MAMPQIIKVNFGDNEMPGLHKYIKDQVNYIWTKQTKMRMEDLPHWIRIYRGTPETKEAKFPWPGAANLVVQIAGTHCDELLSRVMAIWQTAPIYTAELYGDFEDGLGQELRSVIEFFLDKMAFEPTELDLFRVEETVFSSTIRNGTGIIKFPYEYLVEKQPVSIDGAANAGSKQHFSPVIKRDGPHPEAVPLNLFGIDSRFANLANSNFIYHVLTKHKTEVEDMLRHDEIYNTEAVKSILLKPDRNGPDEYHRALNENKESDITVGNDCDAEWDIYECWLQYHLNGDIYNLISYYHKYSETHLGTIFNFYPDNIWPFEDAKLAYDDESYFGYGFCEMLESYQEEVSKTHNWRQNAKNFAMTGIGRVNKNSKLSSIIQLFPGLLIPADEGEIEPLAFGTQAITVDTSEEQLTLALAKERSGVDPAISGAGGGIVNAKRGIYSAQGTAAVMQQQNNRNNLRMADMRSAHVRMGRKLTDIYSHFGIGIKGRMFGSRTELLLKALEYYKDKKIGLGIKAATASVNRELEKQNDILLASTLERLYAGDAQIIQALSTPGISPPLLEYYEEVLKAKNCLYTYILRNFGRDDVQRLIPVPSSLKEQRHGAINAGAGAGQNSQLSLQNGGVIPIGTRASSGSVPTGTSQ